MELEMKEAVNEITDGFEVIDVGFVERPFLDAEPDQIVFLERNKTLFAV